jgi:hypothetical protein
MPVMALDVTTVTDGELTALKIAAATDPDDVR